MLYCRVFTLIQIVLFAQMLLSMAGQNRIAEAGSVYDGDSIPVAVWGSRAHLEKQALATVSEHWGFLF